MLNLAMSYFLMIRQEREKKNMDNAEGDMHCIIASGCDSSPAITNKECLT